MEAVETVAVGGGVARPRKLALGRPCVPMPLALRWDGARRARAAVAALRDAIRTVRAGGCVMDALADGSLGGWYARQALGTVIGTVRVPEWDAGRFRTRDERLAALKAAVAHLRARWGVR